MNETGVSRIKILGEMLEFAEHALRKQLLAQKKLVTQAEIEARISEWYSSPGVIPEGQRPRIADSNRARKPRGN
jgi:hypothetical protein